MAAELPPADNTAAKVTKRKLTDAITALDEAVKSPLGSTATTPRTKKAKVAGRLHATISTPALISLLSTGSTTLSLPTPSPTPSLVPTTYTPLSLPSLLSRLSTYRHTTFSPSKPSSLSPLSCALQGWSNISPGRDRIQCVTCGKGLVLSNDEKTSWGTKAGERLRQEYEALLKEGHEGNCPWRMKGANRSLYRVNVEGRKKTLAEVRKRGDEFRLAGCEGLGIKEGHGVSKEEVESVLKALMESEEGKECSLDESVVLLALFGWTTTTTTTTSPTIIECPLCTRQILTTSYLSSTTSPKDFDLIGQHQPFCPFVDSTTTTIRPGWQLRLDTILQRTGGGRRASVESTASNSAGGFAWSQSGEGEGGSGGEKKKVGTRELLSYVRGLLGPKK